MGDDGHSNNNAYIIRSVRVLNEKIHVALVHSKFLAMLGMIIITINVVINN